jgi:hypothetical protein
MDIPTRVGIGGTALFTVAGSVQPLFGWWVSGPIMAVCAVVAGWGFWPLVSDHLSIPFFGPVPFDDAALRIYEAAEKAGALDLMVSSTTAPKDKLMHFKMLLLCETRVRLFGAEPPSTRSHLIPEDKRHGQDTYPSDKTPNALDHLFPADHPPAYLNVTVPRKDLRRVIKIYLDEYVGEVRDLRAGKWPR